MSQVRITDGVWRPSRQLANSVGMLVVPQHRRTEPLKGILTMPANIDRLLSTLDWIIEDAADGAEHAAKAATESDPAGSHRNTLEIVQFGLKNMAETARFWRERLTKGS